MILAISFCCYSYPHVLLTRTLPNVLLTVDLEIVILALIACYSCYAYKPCHRQNLIWHPIITLYDDHRKIFYIFSTIILIAPWFSLPGVSFLYTYHYSLHFHIKTPLHQCIDISVASVVITKTLYYGKHCDWQVKWCHSMCWVCCLSSIYSNQTSVKHKLWHKLSHCT